METAHPIPQAVLEELETAYLRVSPAPSALRLWQRVLSVQDRSRLGGDFERAYAEAGTIGMWQKLRGVSRQRALIEVAKKIGFITEETEEFLLRAIGDLPTDADEAIARAAAEGALIVVERPRTAYWNREKIEVAWHAHSALWDYLFELCRSAKASQPIDRFAFGGEVHEDYLAKQKYRLSKLEGFPFSLLDRITSAGRGTQRLDVAPEQIRIFELATVEVLRERTG